MSAVIFDLDGTLIDSAPDIHAAVNRLLVAEGHGALSLPQVTSFIGNGVTVLLTRVAEAVDLPPDPGRQADWQARFAADYEGATSLTRLYPGARQALEALLAAGHRLGLCTNKPAAPTRAVLNHFDLTGHFAAVIAGDSLPQRKPDPAPLHATVTALGGGPAVFVGDSEVDAATASAAGLPFALFTEGYRKRPVEELAHDATFTHFAALPAIAETLLAAPGRRL